MPAPVVSDEQFLDAWAALQSPTLVAQKLGITIRSVFSRRTRMEKRLGYAITSLPKVGRPATPAVVFEHYRGRLIDSSQDGHVIVFSDAHFWPGERTTAFRGLLKLCRELKPRVVVANGDCFDGSTVSRFQRIGWDQRPTVKQEIDATDAALTEIEDASKGARFYWPLGNHDARFEIRIANTLPDYEGVPGFTLKERFPRWLPCWSVWLGDHTVIKHRFKGGIHATHQNTLTAGKNMVTGHLHSLKVSAYTDYNGNRFGVDTGTLSDIYGQKFEGYVEDNPRNWRSGFVVLTLHKGKLLWPEVAAVHDEEHIDFRGRLIEVGK